MLTKKGRPCKVCSHTGYYAAVEAAGKTGRNLRELAEELGIDVRGIRRHLQAGCAPDRVKPIPPVEVKAPSSSPAPPGGGPAISERDRADAHCKWLHAKLQWAETNGRSPSEVMAISKEYGGATRLLAKLNGAFDITETQIVRSTPWKRIMAEVMRCLEKHPAALLDLQRVLGELDTAGKL